VTGETYDPPFRLRMSFSLQGGFATGYLALAAPGTITATAPYTGESYVRLTTDGSYIGGTWHGEAELFAIPAGASDPVVIVRDTYEAILQPEADMLNPEGVGVRHTNTQYFPVPQQSDTFAGGNWTCLNGCPAGAGATLIDGSNVYAYGPYAGQQHLLTFSDGRTFRNDIDSDCL